MAPLPRSAAAIAVVLFGGACSGSPSAGGTPPPGIEEAAPTDGRADATQQAWAGATVEPLATWPVGKGPDALHLDEKTGLLYVANVEDTVVSVLDVASGSTRASLEVPLGPWGIVPLTSRRIAVSSWESAVSIIDLDAVKVVKSLSLPFKAGGLVATADGARVLVVAPEKDQVYPVEVATGAVGAPLSTEAGPDGIGRLVDGSAVVVANTKAGTIEVIDLGTGEVRTRHQPGGKPELVHASHDGALLLVSNFDNDAVHLLDRTTGALLRSVEGIDGPEDPATDEGGTKLFVASFESGFVETFDLATGAPLAVRYRTGTKPIGVVVRGARLYVSNYGDNTVTAYNLDSTE